MAYFKILAFISALAIALPVGAQSFASFYEVGSGLHAGDNTPLWQASNRHGFSSIKNHGYVRAGSFLSHQWNGWEVEAGVDVAVAAGFTSGFIIQQMYADIKHRGFALSVGSKEINSSLLNPHLSSGGLTWSGNARPVPQVKFGIPEYIRIFPAVFFKAELSYGWFTDNNYQKKQVGTKFWYTKDIKYHHKEFFFRFGKPHSRWIFDVGMSLDVQFGGYNVGGLVEGDLGNGLKDYFRVLIPRGGSKDDLETYYQGNFMGSEHIRLTYKLNDFTLSAYLENYYDDFSGMGKQNGMDGLWGIEYKSATSQIIDGIVLEYYQTTNQSGPLHGLDDSEVKKTGGADDYYNNDLYPGWVHWGMTMANPLIASPIYNKDGDMTFKYNRVKAIHLGWQGTITEALTYRAKISYNQTWGTPFKPFIEILENYSTFVESNYMPQRMPGWNFCASLAFDMGGIYGDNLGLQIKVRKNF